MGFINLNNKTNNRSQLLPEGIYEMKIHNVVDDASPNGHKNLNFDFVVRDDLDKVPELKNTNAVAHGRHYYASVWTAKDKQTGEDTGHFAPADLANIADAIGLTQDEVDKQINSKEDLMKVCIDKCIRIRISVYKNTYKGETRKQNSTFTNSWRQTKFPPQGAKEDPFKGNEGASELTDKDIPF